MQNPAGSVMRPFEYRPVLSVEEACAQLAQCGPDASILAGGTDLLIEWRRPTGNSPRAVVDISHIEDLKGIASEEGWISLKPLTTHADVLKSSIVREFAPLLAMAASSIGSPQIRNRGTVGGNIMNAATCADCVPPLVALGATVTLRSNRGSRQLELANLFIRPYHTQATPDEVLTDIRFRKPSTRTRSSFIKLGRRNAVSISRLSVAASLEQDGDGSIVNAYIVPGAALPAWQRVAEAESMLVGEKPSAALFAAAGRKVSEVMIAQTGRRWSTEYKEPVIAVLVRRALEQCAAQQIMQKGARA
jgi:CO/xanthine dehydrogenase FAD-binding subunit